jgi:hypothetical protein
MSYAYDRYLPPGMTWRDLFDMVSSTAQRGTACHNTNQLTSQPPPPSP